MTGLTDWSTDDLNKKTGLEVAYIPSFFTIIVLCIYYHAIIYYPETSWSKINNSMHWEISKSLDADKTSSALMHVSNYWLVQYNSPLPRVQWTMSRTQYRGVFEECHWASETVASFIIISYHRSADGHDIEPRLVGGNSYSLALYIVQCNKPDYSPAGRTGSRCHQLIQRETKGNMMRPWIMPRILFSTNAMQHRAYCGCQDRNTEYKHLSN